MLYRLSYASRANQTIVPERTQNCKEKFSEVSQPRRYFVGFTGVSLTWTS